MVDLKDLAVIETSGAKGLDVDLADRSRRLGQTPGVVEGGQLAPLEGLVQPVSGDGRHDSGVTVVVAEQLAQAGGVMVDTVGASIQVAHLNADGLQERHRQLVLRVVQHRLVQPEVPGQGVRAQAVRQQDVVDRAVRAGDAVVGLPQARCCFLAADGRDPGHGRTVAALLKTRPGREPYWCVKPDGRSARLPAAACADVGHAAR